jgi:hypothetical protein
MPRVQRLNRTCMYGGADSKAPCGAVAEEMEIVGFRNQGGTLALAAVSVCRRHAE